MFTVTLEGGISTENVTVMYRTVDSSPLSAIAGIDYTAVLAGSPESSDTIGDGRPSRIISVPTISDTQEEEDETFILELTDARGGGGMITLSATASSATATIIDDDRVRVSLTGPFLDANDDSGVSNSDFITNGGPDRSITFTGTTNITDTLFLRFTSAPGFSIERTVSPSQNVVGVSRYRSGFFIRVVV